MSALLDRAAEATKAMWARCVACNHCWPVAYYPMSLATFAKTAKQNSKACPKCGAKNAVVAKQANGDLLEEPRSGG